MGKQSKSSHTGDSRKVEKHVEASEKHVGTAEKHVALKTFGGNLMPSQGTANFSTRPRILVTKSPPAVAGPPYTPYPRPNLLQDPWTPRNADTQGAVAGGSTRQKRYGLKEQFPSVAHTAMTHLCTVAAGEVAGVWEKFGSMGATSPNFSFCIGLALRADQEMAAKFLAEQNRELRQIARGCQDIRQVESRPRQPDQLLIARVVEDQQKEHKARTGRRKKGTA